MGAARTNHPDAGHDCLSPAARPPVSAAPPRKPARHRDPEVRVAAATLHWPEYLMEALGLGLFMISAGLFGILLEHPSSPVRGALGDPFLRRLLMGLAMGATAVAIILSPFGQRSGAHINPAVTLTFRRLGKIAPADTVFYILFQCLGGAAGILLVRALGAPLHAVGYVATQPGMAGILAALGAEVAISFVLMLTVLVTSNHPRLFRRTPFFVATLVTLYIAFEAPVSGMSMNPARTLAAALAGGGWTGFWIYVVAPPLGMLLAAELYVRRRGLARVFCAKLHHDNRHRCIFACNFGALAEAGWPRPGREAGPLASAPSE
jgi:aquaporin Z